MMKIAEMKLTFRKPWLPWMVGDRFLIVIEKSDRDILYKIVVHITIHRFRKVDDSWIDLPPKDCRIHQCYL